MSRRLAVLLLTLFAAAMVIFSVSIGPEEAPSLHREGEGEREPPQAPVLVGARHAEESVVPTDAGDVHDEASQPQPWFLVARVISDDDETSTAIEGAAVRVYLQVGWDYEPLATGTTGADGRVGFDLRSLSERARNQLGLGRLVAFTSAPGHFLRRGMPDRVFSPIGDDLEPTPWSLEVELAPKPVVRGRVLRETGEPLPKAAVFVIAAEGGRRLRDLVFTDPEGRFAVPAPEAGRFRICSQRRDVEARCSEAIVVDGMSDHEVPDIKLASLPSRPGVVRFQDGSPVADLTLEITHPYFDPCTYLWSPRLGPVRIRTDSLGRFSAVLPRTPDFGREAVFSLEIPGVRSEDTGFDPETDHFEITLPPHRLRVRLRDGTGGPLRGQDVAFHLGGSRWSTIGGTTDDRGEASLFVRPGADGRLRIVRTGNAPLAVPVRIPETGNESMLVVDVPDETAHGTLGFCMRTPSGATVFPVEVEVQSMDECDVLERVFESDDDRIVLPPGAYKVTLWSSAEQAWEDLPDTRSVVRPDGPIVVRDGEDTVVDVVWAPTAGLALRVRAPGTEAETLPGGRATIEPIDGERRTLGLKRRGGSVSRILYTTEWMFSPWLYEPGIYRITLEAEGYRSLTREVWLAAGAVTRIELEMERAP